MTLKSSSTAISIKVGKSLQIKIPTVGSKSVTVNLSIKDPSGNSFAVASTTIAKNKSYVTPFVKFSKLGNFTVTISLGTTKKSAKIKVIK